MPCRRLRHAAIATALMPPLRHYYVISLFSSMPSPMVAATLMFSPDTPLRVAFLMLRLPCRVFRYATRRHDIADIYATLLFFALHAAILIRRFFRRCF